MIKSKKIIALLATIAMLFFGAFALCLTNTEQNRAFANETNPVVLMVDGAEVRISMEKSGLRFIGKLSKSYFSDTETPTLKDGVTVGMLLGKDEVTWEDLTLENVVSKDLKNAVINKWDISRSTDNYINFNVAITSIPDTDYGVSVIARAYVTENSTTKYSENTCTRSIAEVADAALAENVFTNELNDTAKGICQNFVSNDATALTVDGLTVLDGKVKWNENSNAKGYIVSYNDEIKQVKDANELSLTLADSDKNVKVVAYGDGVTYSYSTVAEKSVHALAEKELANFNNATYESDLTAGGAIVDWGISEKNTSSDKTNTSYIGFGSGTPKYESDKTGSNNGAVLVKSKITNYGGFSAKHSVFTVDLQKTIDTESYSGIKVRIQLKECDLTNAGNIYFKLLGDEESEGYLTDFTSANERPDNTSPQTEALTADEWVELTITNEQLKSYYANETDKLYFAFVIEKGVSASIGYSVSGYLDYIKYYNVPAAPTGLKIKDGTLSWNAVDGATSYIIECNDSTNEVMNMSYTLPTITSDCTVSVYAKNTEGTSLASTINYHSLAENEIANFNNASYNDDITCGPVASNAATPDYTDMRTSGYASNVEGSNNGAMDINKWICSYGSGSNFEGERKNVVFGVKLQKGLEVTKNIVVRFRIYAQNANSGETGLQLVGADNDTQNYTGYNYRQVATVNEWMELKLSASDLAACGYKNGDTLIVFAVRNQNGISVQDAAKVYIDYICYDVTD